MLAQVVWHEVLFHFISILHLFPVCTGHIQRYLPVSSNCCFQMNSSCWPANFRQGTMIQLLFPREKNREPNDDCCMVPQTTSKVKVASPLIVRAADASRSNPVSVAVRQTKELRHPLTEFAPHDVYKSPRPRLLLYFFVFGRALAFIPADGTKTQPKYAPVYL